MKWLLFASILLKTGMTNLVTLITYATDGIASIKGSGFPINRLLPCAFILIVFLCVKRSVNLQSCLLWSLAAPAKILLYRCIPPRYFNKLEEHYNLWHAILSLIWCVRVFTTSDKHQFIRSVNIIGCFIMFITCFYMPEFTSSSECILLGQTDPYECMFDTEHQSIGHKLPEICMMFSLTLGSFLKRCAEDSTNRVSDANEKPTTEAIIVPSCDDTREYDRDFMIKLFAKTFAETVARINCKSQHTHVTLSHANTKENITNEEVYQRLIEYDPKITECTTRDSFRKRLKQARTVWRNMGNCPSLCNNLDDATRVLRKFVPA